jgi:hypothetical protein
VHWFPTPWCSASVLRETPTALEKLQSRVHPHLASVHTGCRTDGDSSSDNRRHLWSASAAGLWVTALQTCLTDCTPYCECHSLYRGKQYEIPQPVGVRGSELSEAHCEREGG